MYGTIARIQPKTGKEAELIGKWEEWNRERGPKVKGSRGGYLFKLDNGGFMGVAVFESREDYVANAEDPEQDRWYQGLRELLESDPEWNDGEIVAAG